MNYKDHHSISMDGLSMDEALRIVTGKTPEPINIECPVWLEQKQREGQMRNEHRITQRSEWLAQLRRFHPNASIPSE
ncbi:MAG: hypothetical protein P1U89_12910 [Verrucomicrobiales bacterium]|nr:hypothetical protein [Verrucomicrobiales bacterium]